VSEVRCWRVHQGAAAVDDRDSPCSAEHGGTWGDAALAEGSMHPDPADPQLGAFLHDRFGPIGSGGDHHGFDASGDGVQARIAGVALYLPGVGVDGEHRALDTSA